MAGADDLGANSSSIINYLCYKDFPILSNHKEYKQNDYIKSLRNNENINKFDNDFIAISDRFASLNTNCVLLRREHKGIEPFRRVKLMY